MKNCYIIAAGKVDALPIKNEKGDLVIAADGGLATLKKHNITADLVIGDFDSLGYMPQGENVLSLPIEKDDTDTLAAIKYAIKNGADRIFIYGGTGGRLDHTIANLQALKYIAESGKKGFLVSENEVFTVIKNTSIVFKEKAVGNISVFSLDEKAVGVFIRGLYYELYDATLKNSYPLGVSNKFKGEASTVSVKEGTLLIAFNDLNIIKEIK